MSLVYKKMLLSLCFLGFVLSISLNMFLAFQAKHYYSENKLNRVFPFHEQAYKSQNISLLSKSKEKTRVVLFGDSRINQWHPLPSIEQVDFVNRGIGGETTVQLKHRIHQDAINLEPDIVVLQLGINDLVTIGVAPKNEKKIVQQTVDNIRQMVNQLLKQDAIVILLTIISPSKPSLVRLPVWSQRISVAVRDVNTQLLSLSPQDKLHVIDAENIFSDKGEVLNNLYADTLHLSAEGYRHLNTAIQHLISK